MAERDPLWLQGGNYTATEDRMALAALTGARWPVDLAVSTSPLTSAGGGHGVVGAGDLAVTADGAGMDVTVAAGMAMVRGTQQGDQGVYVVANDAAKTISISASDATNPRKDLVVIRVKDAEFGIAGDVTSIEVVTGTPTGGLTAGNATGRPTPPENALILAEVLVPAGATSNATFTITTDHTIRTRATGLGGAIICTSTTRPNPATEGMVIAELDTDKLLVYSGAAWSEFAKHGAWESYTPVVAGTGWALGNGTVVGKFRRLGNWVEFWARITFGSTSTFGGANAPTITVPVTMVSSDHAYSFDAKLIDVSAGLTYPGFGSPGSTTAALINNINTAATFAVGNGVVATTPFTWANGDQIVLSGRYETA